MRRNIFLLFTLLLSCVTLIAQNSRDEQGMEVSESLQLAEDKEAVRKAYDGWWKDSRKNLDSRMEWYNEAKFGCFIHWGVYSVPGGIWKDKKIGGYTEHLMRSAKIPVREYKEELVSPFNPVDFDADEWIQHAIDAGMKYFIVTAKHHDGFAMYFSEAYPYDMRQTAFKRDPMGELREAARKRGLKFGFYYSQAFDWEHPDAPGNDWDFPDHPGGDKLGGGRDWWLTMPGYLVNADKYVREKSIPQVQELIRKYDPDIMWFDTPHKLPLYQNIRILEAIREVDPENKIVVNGRLARFGDRNLGDYLNTGDRAAYFYPASGYWESIPTTNESYGFSKVDTYRKPAVHFVRLLATATSEGGNILMNVGPMGNGKWDQPDIDVFRQVGSWLKVYGEGIYGNVKTDLPVQPWGVTTKKGEVTYLHVYAWPENGELTVGGLTSDISNAWLVSDKNRKNIVSSRLNDKDVVLKLPGHAPDTMNTVIGLTLKTRKESYPVRLLDPVKENTLLSFDADPSSKSLGYGDGKPNRNYVNNWKSNDEHLEWKFRLNKGATYRMYIEYNTSSPEDKGTVRISVDGRSYDVTYVPYTERQGTDSLYIGEIRLSAGEHRILLNGKEYQGNEYMRPIAILLKP
jgi:alpha-L-fucosidase